MTKGVIKSFICAMLFTINAYGVALSDMYTVLSMYIKNPVEVGEIAPFTESVGDELARYIGSATGQYYLEVGGGTGAVTLRLIRKLGSNDYLDVVEINPGMCAILKKRFEQWPNVFIHCCSVLDWKPDYKYASIVSTLPQLALGVDFAQQVTEHFKQLVVNGGMVSYVEYGIVKAARSFIQAVCFNKNSFLRTDVQNFMATVKAQYLKDEITIYGNLPPVTVYHLAFDA